MKNIFRISKIGRLYFIFQNEKVVAIRSTENEASDFLSKLKEGA